MYLPCQLPSAEILNKIKKLTSKILIRVPMMNRDWMTLYKKELSIEWRSDPTHYTEYTVETFRKEMEAMGLKIREANVQFGEIWSVVTT